MVEHLTGVQNFMGSTCDKLNYMYTSFSDLLCFLFSLLTATFKQVAKTVTDVNLRDNVVNVVYKMFDENGKQTD